MTLIQKKFSKRYLDLIKSIF